MSEAGAEATAAEPHGTIPLSHPVKQKIRDGLVAISLANLCFARAWFPALYDKDHGYFNRVPVTLSTLSALAVNLAWSALLVWLVIRGLRRTRNQWAHLAAHLAFFVVLLVPIDFVRAIILDIADWQVVAFLLKPAVLAALAVLIPLMIWKHRWAALTLATLVGILSPLALWVIIRIVLLALGVQRLEQELRQPPLAPPVAMRPGQPRVVWIIFDETDQRLTFEQRPDRLKMPEFDRLRAGGVYATNAYPPADGTLYSMPALISGQRLSEVQLTNDSDLSLTLADSGKVASWKELPSVFGAARELGVNTALVGWYHCYGRVLARDLNYCAWFPLPGFEPGRSLKFSSAVVRQIGCMAGLVHGRALYVDTCQQSLQASLEVVTNATYGCILLHLPPPHKPGIYRPEQHRYAIFAMPKVTGYFNNLMLADYYLGQLRQAMEASGEWDKTWVILSADHSWRESSHYDGRRDLRVPFVIRAPLDNSSSTTYSNRLNTVVTRDLVLAILGGQLTNQQSVAGWLDGHGEAKATPTPSGGRHDY